MNNIIQLIAGKVKGEIEENIIRVLEGEGNLDDIVDSVGEMVNDIGIKTILAIINELNSIIKKNLLKGVENTMFIKEKLKEL